MFIRMRRMKAGPQALMRLQSGWWLGLQPSEVSLGLEDSPSR